MGTLVFNKELSNKVVVDESYWSLEGTGEHRRLAVTLCKKKQVKWKFLLKEEEEALPAKNELDDDFDIIGLEHDDDDPERVEEQLENEKKLEARYRKLVTEKGLDHEDTLQTFFALFDNCIQLYRLNKLSAFLDEVYPVCRDRTDKYKLKAIQALAFVRWKQSRFREALPLFHEMEDILGKGAALCENIAHTYNSLGDYEKAEDYFRQALKFIEQEHGANRGNRGGVLLGLGLVRDRLGWHGEALPVCQKAYDFYKERANGAPASLQAKAGISCAKINAKLGNYAKAEEFIKEAVHMYEVTCGATSPLTASAYHEWGKVLWAQRKRDEAQKALKRAYDIESRKDAWDLVTVLEIHNLLMDTHLKEVDHIERTKFADYLGIVDFVSNRVRKELPQDGNAAVYYKAAGELKAWGGRYEQAKVLFETAIPLLKAETSTDCSSIISTCTDMLAFCDRNLAGQQNSPMDFEVPERSAREGREVNEKEDDVKIEEISDEPADAPPEAQARGETVCSQVDSAPTVKDECKYRAATLGDIIEAKRLCKACNVELLLDDASFATHLTGAGRDVCWVATRTGDMAGMAICGSDGIFGHLLQLLVPASESLELKAGLVKRCATACQTLGLRTLRAAGCEGEGEVFQRLGWETLQVYSSPERPQKKSRMEGVLRRDGRDTGEYYGAWEQIDVEKELLKEDGLDPSAVLPDISTPKDEFGVTDLDTTRKITRYSWDQSDKFVSLYVPYDRVHTFSSESIQVIFRHVGVLLTITDGGKTFWFKVPNLCKEINTESSTKKVKEDQVVIKLRKAEVGQKWSDLTDDKDRYQKMREYRINHGDLKGATTEELLADMYQNANDEERSGLRDAMRVNRQKREEEGTLK